MNGKIAILGGGPGAMFAYFAALEAGYTLSKVTLFAEKLTYPVGAFWLYELPAPCEGVEPSPISMSLKGSTAVYSQKQWGDTPYATSAEKWKNGGLLMGYDPILLMMYFQQAKKQHLGRPLTQTDVDQIAAEYDYVIQTFPLSREAHTATYMFRFPVYVADLPAQYNGVNYCIYNGDWKDDWTRMTIAFNRVSVEYPSSYRRLGAVIKANNDEAFGTSGKVLEMPDLHPETEPITEKVVGDRKNILLTGRWTTLERSHLAHHTRDDVFRFLEGKSNGQAFTHQPQAQQQTLHG